MAWNSLHTFGTELLRNSLYWLGLYQQVSTEDYSCLIIKAYWLSQLFSTSTISSSLLMRAWLGRSRTRWSRGSRCLISGVYPSISAWTLNALGSITQLTSISKAIFGQSCQSSEWMNAVQLQHQLQWSFTRGSPTKKPAIRPYTNRCSEASCRCWPPLGPISHMPLEFSAGKITSRAMRIW